MKVYDIVTLLNITHHRASWPAVRWIEEHVAKGDSDWGEHYKEVVEGAKISFDDSEFWVEYLMEEGKAVCLSLPNSLFQMMEDVRKGPSVDELLLYKMVHPQGYRTIEDYCAFLKVYLNKPHNGRIHYRIRTEECSGAGCTRRGEVNYFGHKDLEFYCGGSPRCCP